jgi:hypothetical protein
MKNTNKIINIEFNPVNGNSFMNDLRNKYMEKQTAVEWIVNKLSITFQTMYSEEIEQAKEMEKEQRMIAYNAGHADGLCNHINDADNYINEQNYLKGENID